jgi:hypothetical protein
MYGVGIAKSVQRRATSWTARVQFRTGYLFVTYGFLHCLKCNVVRFPFMRHDYTTEKQPRITHITGKKEKKSHYSEQQSAELQ